MIINPAVSNEKGLSGIKLIILCMKDIRDDVVQVSCDQSGGEGGILSINPSYTKIGKVWCHKIVESKILLSLSNTPKF